MDPFFAVGFALFALLLGVGVGWFAGSRPSADLKRRLHEAEAGSKELSEKLSRMVAELATMSERAARADTLAVQLDSAREELTALKAQAAGFEEQKRLLVETRAELLKEFQNTGSKVLGEAQEAFLRRAQERFKQSEETGEQRIKALLAPVGEKLEAYERSVREIETDRKKEYGSITSLMEQVRLGQEAVKAEANNIVTSLRAGPKTSGRWGEQQFKNLIELAGLSEFTDFRAEVSVKAEDGILRPDYVINLPGERQLIVDIKCPLDSYLSATEKLDPTERKSGFESFSLAVKGHANALSRKAYWTQFEKSPDFVILYIPGDNFLTAALEHLPMLWEEAARNRVIISGPATFFPLARTIASMWDQEKLTDKAEEVLQLGRDLHHNLSIMTSRIRKLGDDINKTAKSYNDFVTSIDGRVIQKARRFEELNLTASDKRLGDITLSDEQLKPLQRLSGPDEE